MMLSCRLSEEFVRALLGNLAIHVKMKTYLKQYAIILNCIRFEIILFDIFVKHGWAKHCGKV